MSPDRRRLLLKLWFLTSLAVLAFAYGYAAGIFKIFPHPQLAAAGEALAGIKDGLSGNRGFYFFQVPHREPIRDLARTQAGPSLVTRVTPDQRPVAEIIALDGTVLHQWDCDWWRVWPDASHLPPELVPKSRPGTHIHGAVVLADGSLVFNYENQGLVRLRRDGSVAWRLAHITHHSVHLHDDGRTLWVGGGIYHATTDARFPHRRPPFLEHVALEVDAEDGSIRQSVPLEELIAAQRPGLLHMMSSAGVVMAAPAGLHFGDLLHLNDVESFPEKMTPGVFGPGDLLLSLRNVNTVVVLGPDRRITFISTGELVRQHDPDFLDGDRILVYDNNHRASTGKRGASRIRIIDGRDGSITTAYEGDEKQPFYSHVMGKQQLLANGNLLITESMQGRAFEVAPDRSIVWEYRNPAESGYHVLVEEVSRLPASFTAVFSAP